MTRTIGLYGGFFNHLHEGHLHVIKTSAKSLNLKKLILLPTYQNPLKENQNPKSIYSQVSDLRLQIKEPLVKVSDFEHRYQVRSTYDVLKKISSKCSLNSFYLIIGLDQLGHFHEWMEYEWIIKNISIRVTYRPRYDDFIETSTVTKQPPNLFVPNLAKSLHRSTTFSSLLADSGANLSYYDPLHARTS